MKRFGSSLWLIPLSILIHNLEEYPRIVAYARRHGVGINRRQMGIAVLLATLLPIPVALVLAFIGAYVGLGIRMLLFPKQPQTPV